MQDTVLRVRQIGLCLTKGKYIKPLKMTGVIFLHIPVNVEAPGEKGEGGGGRKLMLTCSSCCFMLEMYLWMAL
jgi:hypothetical protein